MSNETASTSTSAPASGGLTAAAGGAAPAAPSPPADKPNAPGAAPGAPETPKPPPGVDEWSKRSAVEKQQRERSERLKKDRAELEARAKTISEQEAVLAAIREKDPAKIIELIGLDGFQKVSTHLLKNRKPGAAGAAKPTEDVAEIVKKAIADHDAEKERKASEEREKTEKASAAATDARFGALTKQAIGIVKEGGERYAQIAAELVGNPEAEKLFDATLRSIDRMMTSPEGWKVGEKALRGTASLDIALDMLDTYLVDRAVSLMSAKARARLSSLAEKPAEEGGTRKSDSGGPKTLTQRLSTETPALRSGSAPENESPLARKQREDAEALAKAIAETEQIIAKKP